MLPKVVMRSSLGMLAAGASLLAWPVYAAPTQLRPTDRCPDVYTVYSAPVADVADAPPGWGVLVQGEFKLRAAGVMEGIPEKKGVIVGSFRELKDGSAIDTYSSLEVNRDIKKWLWCGYGDGAEIMLYRPLRPGTKSCVIRYKPGSGPTKRVVGLISCS